MAGPSSPRFARTRAYWRDPHNRRRVGIGILACIAFFAMALVGLWTRACANDQCSIAGLTGYDPAQASKVYAADGRQIADFGLFKRTVVPLKEMSPAVPAAFLAVEDKRFYQHHGVDWVRFFGALKHMVFRASLRQGFSTITMQLAGNLLPEEINRQKTGVRGIPRKIREIRVAGEIEKKYTKSQILEMYLNQINLGNGAYGVEAAASRYFGKSARNLNVAEAATLAALPKAPDTYNPRKHPRNAVFRRNLVIDLMAEAGNLTGQEAEAWKNYPLTLSSRSDYQSVAEYFVEYVRQIMQAKFGGDLYKDGFRIYTTLDLDAQQAAVDALESQLEKIESNGITGVGKFRHQTYRQYIDRKSEDDADHDSTRYLQGGALVLEAKTGHILAMVGGRDFADSKFNRMTQAFRQPGSSFKPVVYSAAVQSGVSLSDSEPDAPITVSMPFGQPPWEPKNYEGTFSDSMMTIRHGLEESKNSIAVRVGLKVGVEGVIAEARKFGITAPIDPAPSIFIGTPSVRPIEMIAAYTTFANLGTRTVPNAILRVEDKNGKIIWQPETQSFPVLNPADAYAMNQALVGVIRNGTANGAVYRAGFTLPAGGKTGTTSDYHDVWFIGFTHDLVAGVWMGFDAPQPIMGNAQGGKLAAPAWTQMMLDIYQRRKEPSDWAPLADAGDSLVAVEIDKSNGLRATPFCPANLRVVRYYARGTEPKEFCPIHSPFRPGGGGN
ncbi:MAG TPA: PBP1A family penicillin-binding protein [Gemmatimonadales bacterium]|jgi:penicillin-binding protein 1A